MIILAGNKSVAFQMAKRACQHSLRDACKVAAYLSITKRTTGPKNILVRYSPDRSPSVFGTKDALKLADKRFGLSAILQDDWEALPYPPVGQK